MAGWNRTRRDFLNGVALGGAGLTAVASGAFAMASGEAPAAARGRTAYPPALTGMRGSHPGSFEVAHALARGAAGWSRPHKQTDASYDLVVVGAGISGLAAACLYREQVPDARILLLDNHDDFGGHARRNEFRVGGRTLLGYGGSQSLESPGRYSPVARRLIEAAGVDVARFHDYFDQAFDQRHGLGAGVLFRQGEFDATRLVPDAAAAGTPDELQQRLQAYPVSAATRVALARVYRGEFLQTGTVHAQIAQPRKTPAEAFLREACALTGQGIALLRDLTLGFWGFGLDGLSLAEVVEYRTLGAAFSAAATAMECAATDSAASARRIPRHPPRRIARHPPRLRQTPPRGTRTGNPISSTFPTATPVWHGCWCARCFRTRSRAGPWRTW